MRDRPLRALIFDVDGTLAETEELHRRAFNAAFADRGLDITWTQADYSELLKVTGGQRRLLAFFARQGQPANESTCALSAELHAAKNRHYAALIAGGEASLRPGIADLIQCARAQGVKAAIATTTGRGNLMALLDAVGGDISAESFEAIVTGDDVSALKPHPEVYLRALAGVGASAGEAVALEDSAPGLQAALAAELVTIVTPSLYTRHHDFTGAALVIDNLAQWAGLTPDPVASVAALLGRDPA